MAVPSGAGLGGGGECAGKAVSPRTRRDCSPLCDLRGHQQQKCHDNCGKVSPVPAAQ